MWERERDGGDKDRAGFNWCGAKVGGLCCVLWRQCVWCCADSVGLFAQWACCNHVLCSLQLCNCAAYCLSNPSPPHTSQGSSGGCAARSWGTPASLLQRDQARSPVCRAAAQTARHSAGRVWSLCGSWMSICQQLHTHREAHDVCMEYNSATHP